MVDLIQGVLCTLLVILFLTFLMKPTRSSKQPLIRLGLYGNLPKHVFRRLEQRITSEYPNVTVSVFDCYRENRTALFKEKFDVAIIDSAFLPSFVAANVLAKASLPLDKDDLYDFARKACFLNGTQYGVPVLACSHFVAFPPGEQIDFAKQRFLDIANRHTLNMDVSDSYLPYYYAMLLEAPLDFVRRFPEVVQADELDKALREAQRAIAMGIKTPATPRVGFSEEILDGSNWGVDILRFSDQISFYVDTIVVSNSCSEEERAFADVLSGFLSSPSLWIDVLGAKDYLVSCRKSVMDTLAERRGGEHETLRNVLEKVESRAVPFMLEDGFIEEFEKRYSRE